ncbi:MAG: hypothetical protein ACYCST_06695 [Acidimicrobiales bacterium]
MHESDGAEADEPRVTEPAPAPSYLASAGRGYATVALFGDLIPSSCRATVAGATVALGDWALVRALLQSRPGFSCSICDVDGPARASEATLKPCEDAEQLLSGQSVTRASGTPGREPL